MRLHSVEVMAFGPFTERVQVDFEALGSHGLFLLHGATGAGKTSLLDAVCYALYGQVPGRRATTALRSDLAPAEAEPVVIVEFSVGSKRLRVRRSPGWDRPKKRGSGTTPQQAAVQVCEWDGEAWRTRATRLDEAGLLLSDALGMNMDQFTKVVLLPQGEFAAFLHAPADERRNLLQKLFGTERFEVVEGILAEQRRELGRKLEAASVERGTLLARVAERADSVQHLLPAPTDSGTSSETLAAEAVRPTGAEVEPSSVQTVGSPSGADSAPGHGNEPEPNVTELLRRIDEELIPRGEAVTFTAEELDRLRSQLTRHEAHLAGFRAWSQVNATRSSLLSQQPQIETISQRLQAAERAGSAAGPLEVLARDERELAEARRDQAAALEAVMPLLAAQTLPGLGLDISPTDSDLASAATERRKELGQLERLITVEQALAGWRREEQQWSRGRETVQTRHTQLTQERQQLSVRVTELEQSVAQAARIAATADGAHRELQHATRAAASVQELSGVQQQLSICDDARREAIDRAQSARGVAQDLTRRRLADMAAELAAGLAEGAGCPVCGSVTHPQLATPSQPSVSPEAEELAIAAADNAEQEATHAAEKVASLRERVSALTAAAEGLTEQAALQRLEHARAAAARAGAAAAEEAQGAQELQAMMQRLPDLDSTIAGLEAEVATWTTRITEAATRILDAQVTITEAIGSDGTVWSRHERLTREAKLLESARDSVTRLTRAGAAVKRARTAAVKACRAAGFEDVAAARLAVVTDPELSVLREQVRDHRDRLLAVEARLSEVTPQGWQPETVSEHDLVQQVSAAAVGVRQAGERHREAVAAVDWLERTRTAAADLAVQLQRWQKRFAPLQARHEVVREVSLCAEGSGSNALRMRLSAYVLASRLDQVAQAASLRLAQMSGDRYTLVHTESARRGGRRSGLGISVLDAWTGRERDPGSLSGGETFLASLALALGLADVVQAEAGGSAIETLFVDEGFGSLDDESLDLVMDILDGLREGGRAVGVVSHVPELRTRIPAQIEVLRRPSGSVVRTV